MGDILVIKLGERLLGLETSEVERITGAGSVHFVPGRASFVSGMISLHGEPVVVVDAAAVFGTGDVGKTGTEASAKIVIVRDKKAALGLDVGRSEVRFLWEEDIKGKTNVKDSSPFISERVETGGTPVEIMDWRALFKEAGRILSVKGQGV